MRKFGLLQTFFARSLGESHFLSWLGRIDGSEPSRQSKTLRKLKKYKMVWGNHTLGKPKIIGSWVGAKVVLLSLNLSNFLDFFFFPK